MKIALIGSTGRIGRHLAQEARSRGHEVLALLHEARSTLQEGTSSRIVDVFDGTALPDAVRGQDAVVSAYGAPADAPHLLPQATVAIVKAVLAAGVRRLLTVGGAGGLEVQPGVRLADTAGFPSSLLPKVMAHAQALAVLAGSGLHWTCVAPGVRIGPGERTGRYRLAVGAVAGSSISYPDFACALLDELEGDRHPRQVVGTGY